MFNRGKDANNRKTDVKTSSIPGHEGGKRFFSANRFLSNWNVGVHGNSVYTKIATLVNKAIKYERYSRGYN